MSQSRPSEARVKAPWPPDGTRRRRPRSVEDVLAGQDWHSLTPMLVRAGVQAPDPAILLLRRYCELLLEWNRSVSNLISANDEPRIVERHIREAIEPAAWIRESGGRDWVDFGAGAGLPGIPLAIAGVGSKWLLVESRRPKTLFMRKAVETLSLSKVEVHHGRLEALIEEHGGVPWADGFVSRATLRLSPVLKMAQSVVVQHGKALLWKGLRRDEELLEDPQWKKNWTHAGSFAIGDGQTTVLQFDKN